MVQKVIKMVKNDQNGQNIQNHSKSFKVIQSHSKWSKMVKNGQKWSKMVQNGLKWSKMVQNGQKGSKHSKKRKKNGKNRVFRNGGRNIDKIGDLGCIRKKMFWCSLNLLNLNKKPINFIKSVKKMKIWSMRNLAKND